MSVASKPIFSIEKVNEFCQDISVSIKVSHVLNSHAESGSPIKSCNHNRAKKEKLYKQYHKRNTPLNNNRYKEKKISVYCY